MKACFFKSSMLLLFAAMTFSSATAGTNQLPVIQAGDIIFDPTLPTQSRSETVFVTNTGGGPLTITSMDAVPCKGFTYAGLPIKFPVVLQAGASFSYQVTFSPTDTSIYPCSITFHSDAKSVDSVSNFSGRGMKAAGLGKIMVDPTCTSRHRIMKTPLPGCPVLMKNIGESDVIVVSAGWDPAFDNKDSVFFNMNFNDFSGPIGGYSTKNVAYNVDYKKDLKNVGAHTIQFIVKTSVGNQTVTIVDSATVALLKPITPASYDFGTVIIGPPVTPKTVNVTVDNANGAFSDPVTFVNGDPKVAQANNTFTLGYANGPVAPNSSLTITVNCAPALIANENAILFANGDADNAPNSISATLHVKAELSGVNDNTVVNGYSISQSQPNPASNEATIAFSLGVAGNTTIELYNALGEPIQSLQNGELSEGNQSLTFSVKELASGVYYYKMTSGAFSQTRRLVVTR